eukprot:TRINITY_DN2387_c1_g3_i1.p1 TRINITY_DN2387_c1_g3~~TRINITY_DN2387_c1_g3_i1.p1  ORF type:complete len:362 (+),score=130.58 TRINITY_DN2387_c1_g3_i1:45-1088(+)
MVRLAVTALALLALASCVFALQDASASQKQAIVKEANELCQDFAFDKKCFIKCKSFHMHRLGHDLGLNDQLCLSDCKDVHRTCDLFGVDALKKAKLGQCHGFENNKNCLSILPNGEALSSTSLCKQINANLFVGSNPNAYKSMQVDKLPVNSRTTSLCRNGYCQNQIATIATSCLNTTAKAPLPPIPCSVASAQRMFPLCPVQITGEASCNTLGCCASLNTMATQFFNFRNEGDLDGEIFEMRFFNKTGGQVPCTSSFDGWDGERCVQTFFGYASSTYRGCQELQEYFSIFPYITFASGEPVNPHQCSGSPTLSGSGSGLHRQSSSRGRSRMPFKISSNDDLAFNLF